MKLSQTALKSYQACPRRYYYDTHPAIPERTDYPRLCGFEVHRHVAQLYEPTVEPRPFFFKTRKSALGAWFNRWKREVGKATDEERLILPNPEMKKKYFRIGARCISRYWKQNEELPRPIAVEKRFRTTLRNGDELVGVFDQIRRVSLEWIARHRPELVLNGALAPGYDNVVIVDLKTDYESYDMKAFRANSTLREEVRWQYELHEGRQATTYTFLYEQTTGLKPVGFVWYHLRSGKTFFTFRTDRDYLTLFGIVAHVRENIAAQSFPKNEGKHCRACDHIEACREDRHFLLAEAGSVPETPADMVFVPNLVVKSPFRQLRLPFRRPRTVTPLPPIPAALAAISKETVLVLRDLPWDTETTAPPQTIAEQAPREGTQSNP